MGLAKVVCLGELIHRQGQVNHDFFKVKVNYDKLPPNWCSVQCLFLFIKF